MRYKVNNKRVGVRMEGRRMRERRDLLDCVEGECNIRFIYVEEEIR